MADKANDPPKQDPPKQDSEQSAKQQKAQKEAQLDASKGQPNTAEESNPIAGAHLGAIEGAVDLTKYPDAAESVEDGLSNDE